MNRLSHYFTVSDWLVRPDRNVIVKDDTEQHLEPRVMDLLVYFARHPGEVLDRERIIRHVWPHMYVGASALETSISALRKAFADNPRQPAVFETIPKRGYRLIASVVVSRPVVAVLPFLNLSGSNEQEFLADGITESLITELGCIKAVNVISRQSAMSFRASKLALPEIAEQLHADYVVEGSLLVAGARLRISVQLINGVDDTHLWAANYTPGLDDLLDVQRGVARDIVDQLANRGDRDATSGQDAQAAHPDALLAYLWGRYHWYKLSPAHFPRALEYFEESARIDPQFAPAHAGIADVWGAYGYWGMRPAHEVRERVRNAVQSAVAADQTNAEAQALYAAYEFYLERNWQEAVDRVDRSIELNPSLGHARLLKALFLGALRHPDALEVADAGCRLDPLNPAILLVQAMCFAQQGRLSEAALAVDRINEIDATFPPAHEMRADLHWIQEGDDAVEYERVLWAPDAEMSDVFRDIRPSRDGRSMLRDAAMLLQKRAGSAYVAPRHIVRLLSLAGSAGDALSVLERAIADDDFMTVDILQMFPAYAAVRRHRRYPALLARLGLADN